MFNFMNSNLSDSPQDQYVKNFALSNDIPLQTLLASGVQPNTASAPPTINDVYPDDGRPLPVVLRPSSAKASYQDDAGTTVLPGAQKEAESKSALDELMGQIADHRKGNAARDRNDMWMTFFSNLAANKSPTFGGALADASATLGPSMQKIDASNDARDYEGLKDQIAVEQYKQKQAREEAAQRATEKYQQGELGLKRRALDQGKFAVAKDAMGNMILYNTKTGEAVSQPKANNNNGYANIDPQTGDVTMPFGFDTSNIPPKVFNSMATEDSKRRQADINNLPVAANTLRILDQMEPNLKNFPTGKGFPSATLATGKFFGTDTGTAGANIEKGSNDLATELSKFQYVPGMRGSVLGLQTILASKPGIQQPNQTNENIINGLRAKVTDYQLTGELAQQYRQSSPLKITDQNTYKLDDALKTIYPIEEIDKKTGVAKFNKDNAQKIRDAIPDAISNPQKYFEKAKSIKGSDNTENIPDESTAIQHAKDAIASGAPRDAVIQRLKSMNISTDGL